MRGRKNNATYLHINIPRRSHAIAGPARGNVDVARDTWDAFIGSPNNGYVMTFERSCFCMLDYLGPFYVVVDSSGTVVSAVYLEGSESPGTFADLEDMNLITIPDAFDEIQRAIDEDAFFLNATYDEEGGFPRKVYIDWEEFMADEETSFTFDDVIVL